MTRLTALACRHLDRHGHQDGRLCRHTARGVSLIEMIAAIALLALMLALLPGALDLGRKALSAKPRIETAEALSGAHTALTQWLSAARPIERRLPGGSAVVAFDGGPTTVSFIAVAPDALATGGLATFTLGLVPSRRDGTGNATRDLALSLSSALPTDDGQVGSSPVNTQSGATHSSVLVENVERLSLRYFGAPPPGEVGKRWQETWRERPLLPELIEIVYDPTGSPRQTVTAATRLGRRQ